MSEKAETILANAAKPPIVVCHAELTRFDGKSQFRSECPFCEDGLLPMRRDGTTGSLQRDDDCVVCGQRVIYVDDYVHGELLHGVKPAPMTPEAFADRIFEGAVVR